MTHIVNIPGDFEFRTVVTAFAIPTYDTFDDLSSLPGGFSQFGTVNFQPSGMSCQSLPSGINGLSPKLTDGILLDLKVIGDSSVGEAKIIEIYSALDNRKVSVYVDFLTKEIWLGDGIDGSRPGFRPLIKEASFFLRLTTQILDGKLIARLYTTKLSAFEPPVLQQTVELTDSPNSPTIGTGITVGRIIGNNFIDFSNLGILYSADPDEYYPFPTINEIIPTTSKLNGGNDVSALLNKIIDVELGSENFRTDDNIEDVSTGVSTGVVVAGGTLTLEVLSQGVAAAQFIQSFSGDSPSGADISVDLETDQSLINIPPQLETILAAAELRSGGATVTLELVTSITDGTYFRIMSETETTTLLKSTLISTTSNIHSIRFLRADIKIIVLINGTNVIELAFRSGVGLFKLYASSPSASVNFVTRFTNFVVRPVLVIGNNIASV